MKKSSRGRVVSSTFSILVIAASIVGVTHARNIIDWWELRNYTPPAAVSTLAAEDTMTPQATHIFYVNHPDLDASAKSFRTKCSVAEQTIVLGCYHSNQAGIFVYDVKDPRLHGVEEVTAAHEMLHAAYDRLSSSQKKKVDAMLQDYFDHDLHDQRIIDTMNSYKKTEPDDLVNEMHSIFGTEIADLPAPLETYYSQYFINRAAVVTFANSYESEFTSRQAQINTDDANLATMKAQIEALESSLSSQLDELNAQRGQVENTDSQSQIDTYNAKVSTYNSGVHSLQSQISTYNSLVEARNAIASDLASLQNSLDTRLQTQSAQ